MTETENTQRAVSILVSVYLVCPIPSNGFWDLPIVVVTVALFLLVTIAVVPPFHSILRISR